MKKDARINERGIVNLTLTDLDTINGRLGEIAKALERLHTDKGLIKKGWIDLEELLVRHVSIAWELGQVRDYINGDKLFETKGRFQRVEREINNANVLNQFVPAYLGNDGPHHTR